MQTTLVCATRDRYSPPGAVALYLTALGLLNIIYSHYKAWKSQDQYNSDWIRLREGHEHTQCSDLGVNFRFGETLIKSLISSEVGHLAWFIQRVNKYL